MDLSARVRLAKTAIDLVEQRSKTCLELDQFYFRLGSWELQGSDFGSAKPHLIHGLNLARRTDNLNLEHEILEALGSLYTQSGNRTQFSDCMRQLYSCNKRIYGRNSIEASTTLQQVAGSNLLRGAAREAIPEYIELLRVKELSSSPPLELANLHLDLGTAYRECRQSKEYDEEVRKALDLLQTDKGDIKPADLRLRIAILEKIGEYFQLKNRLDDALSKYLAARELVDHMEPSALEDKIRLDVRISRANRLSGKLVDAKSYAERAVENIELDDSRKWSSSMVWDVYSNAATMEVTFSNWMKARTYYRSAVQIATRAKNQAQMAESLNGLASMEAANADPAKAILTIAEARKIDEKLGNSVSVIGSYLFEASCHQNLGNFVKAIESCQKAVTIVKSGQPLNDPMFARASITMADLYLAVNNRQAATSSFDEGVCAIKRERRRTGQPSANIIDPLSRAGHFELHCGNPSAATKYYRSALKLARQFKLPSRYICQLQNDLATALRDSGNFDEACKLLANNVTGYKKSSGARSSATIEAIIRLGDTQKAGKYWSQAMESYNQALSSINLESKADRLLAEKVKVSIADALAKSTVEAARRN